MLYKNLVHLVCSRRDMFIQVEFRTDGKRSWRNQYVHNSIANSVPVPPHLVAAFDSGKEDDGIAQIWQPHIRQRLEYRA